jgi:hypothetical protein
LFAEAACGRFSLPPDEDTQQADLIPEDNALRRLETPAFGKGEVFGVEAVLGQRLMALGTSLMRLVAAQLEGVCIARLAAGLFTPRTGCICSCRHDQSSFRAGCTREQNICSGFDERIT